MRSRLLLALLLCSASTFARGTTPGWTKALVGHAPGSAELGLVQSVGGHGLQDYDAFRLVTVPAARVAELRQTGATQHVAVEVRDDFDTVLLPRMTVDTRNGKPGMPASRVAYAPGVTGVYVVQFMGPPVSEWMDQVSSSGTVLQGLQANAILVATTSDGAERIGALPFIQWIDEYQPFEKTTLAGPVSRVEAIVEIANVPGKNAVVQRVPGTSRVETAGGDFLVHATLTGTEAEALLREPLVLSVSSEPRLRISDERLALSGTPYITFAGDAPTNPKQYAAWLATTCPNCANLNAQGFKVGIADTGLDVGLNGSGQHPDLSGREFFGTTYVTIADVCVSDASRTCDQVGHGTMLAGVIAGSAATSAADAAGYYLGAGIAPSAGVFSTKTFSLAGAPTNDIFSWAHDARSHSVYIQNHSHNDYSDANGICQPVSGTYTLTSRQYDLAVRDSNNNATDGITPITLTVSAGNIVQTGACDPNPQLVSPPATAKNVISVGAAENYRPDKNSANCAGGDQANDFRNLANDSKRGFVNAGYFKPDLVAPGSMIVSTKSRSQNPIVSYCENNFGGNTDYNMAAGTSFSAPAAAASALLAARMYSTSPADASPALLKAMLVGTTRSMLGGRDVRANQALTARPNNKIGWGLLSIANLVNGYPTRQYVNQTTTFTRSGLIWNKTYYPIEPNQPVTIVLAWSDAPGQAGASAPLVNDLDLWVDACGSTCVEYVGNSFAASESSIAWPIPNSAPHDTMNNLEMVRFTPGSSYTSYKVYVRATSITGQGVPNGGLTSQDFALYVINGLP